MKRLVAMLTVFLGILMALPAAAQVGGGGVGGGGLPGGGRAGGGKRGERNKNKQVTLVLKLFSSEFPAEKLKFALEKLDEVERAEVSAVARRATVYWKGEMKDVQKIEAACSKARVPAILFNPLRITVVPKGRGSMEDLYDSLGLVDGVKSVEAQTNGAIVWAEPKVDLEKLEAAAKDVKFTLSILSHQALAFTYSTKKDDADLDKLLEAIDESYGVVRVEADEDKKTLTVLSIKAISKSRITSIGKKNKFKLKEKK